MSFTPELEVLLNASQRPSGENNGPVSPTESEGGLVSLCRSPFSTDSVKMAKGSSAELLSTTASVFPSGDQSRCRSKMCASGQAPLTFLSAPPIDDTI